MCIQLPSQILRLLREDFPANAQPASQADIEFTIYVVGPINASGTTAVEATSPKDGVELVSDQSDTQIQTDHDTGHFVFSGANEPVYYSVEGSGLLYVSPESGRKTSSMKTLFTSSSAPVHLDTSGGSSKVTAYISGSSDPATVLYVFSGGRLTELPQIEVQSGNNQTGAPSGRLDNYLEVKVTDGKRRAMSGLPVTFTTTTSPENPTTAAMFIPVAGTRVYTDTDETFDNAQESIDARSRPPVTVEATATSPAAAVRYRVQTDRNGVAKIYYQLSSSSGKHTVTATLYGIANLSETLWATASTTARAGIANLEIVSGNNQRAEKGRFLKDDLVVIVRSLAGHRVQNSIIQFRTTTGILVPASGTMQPNEGEDDDDATLGEPGTTRNPTRGQQIYVKTGPNGEAGVTYNVGQLVVARDVVAEVRHEAGDTQYDFAIDRVVFNVNGRTSTGGGSGTAPRQARLTLLPTGDTEGATRSVTVRALNTAGAAVSGVSVTLTGPTGVSFSPTTLTTTTTGTPATSTVTLPSTPGPYLLRATDPSGTYNQGTLTLQIAALGTLSLELVGEQVNGSQTLQVTAQDSDGNRETTAVTVTLRGAGISRTVNVTGSQRVPITLPATSGTLTASASGYRDGTLPLPARSTTTPTTDTTTTTTTPTVSGSPSRISIVGPSTRDGTANTELDAALIVQVVDDAGTAVADARVIFRVRKGQGRLSQRGSGRAVAVQTDSQGYGRANYTPMSASSTVEVEARGVTRRVTFTITASGGTAAPRARDADGAPGTISPVVHVGASQRPPMLWVDGGTIYALVGKDVQKFAPSVDNALNIAVGGGKVYWTEKTGDSAGTINSANLNGSNVQELASILAVPMGIAVSSDNLYWTNSRGRIQSADLDGSGITNVIPGGLEGAMDIALAAGNAYWTQGGNVRFVNLRGQKQIRNISTGTDTANSLAIGGGKVYWTEKTGESAGTVNSANLNGTGAKQLASILAAPMGIAVDGSRSKLYWGNARGRIQSANLDGSKIQNVVDGLGMPGDMVLSNSISAPAEPAKTPTKSTTTAANKYDVNGDGKVDNTDAGLVADAQGTSNAKYDVNGDGRVNFLDLLLVFDNRDDGAAAAPTIVGMQMTAAQVDILQEQIDLLIATGDRSPAALKTLIYLQQLIATARPEKTQLLANYPNPFNPETWIPYELSTDTTVKITIYDTQGVVIRTLALGHQSAGYYTGRDRAAYWDGRNAFGEQVASGIYFYQLETDAMSSMRKMVILK